MSWLFGSKCAACGIKTKDAVAAPAAAGLGLKAKLCKLCADRFQAEAEAKRLPEDFIDAALRGDAGAVQALLAKGADVNAKKVYNGVTALMWASQNGHREVVQALLDKGADVNAKANDGWTALMKASEKGHREVVQALLDKGADVNAKENRGGETALMWAFQNGHREVVQALLAKGADANDLNIKRWKISGEPQAWVWKHLHGWNQNEWLELLASLRKSQYWPMDEAAIGQHLEMLRDQALLEASDLSGANIKRWKLSGEPQAWVRKHLHGWNHNEWLELLASLRKSQYWPMGETAIGQLIETLREQSTSAKVYDAHGIILQPGRSFYCLIREPGPGDPLWDARRKFNELKQWFGEDRRNISSSIFLELAIFSNGDPAIALSGVWGALDSPGLPPDALDGWDLFVDGGISTVRKNEYLRRRTSAVDSVLLWTKGYEDLAELLRQHGGHL